MKKFISIFLVLSLLLSVTACGDDTVSLDVGGGNAVGKDNKNDADYEDGSFIENGDENNASKNTFPKDDGVFKVGVITYSTGDVFATEDFGEDAIIRYNDVTAAVEALKNGKVDAVISDYEIAKTSVAENKGFKILETAYSIEEYAICFPKKSTLNTEIEAVLKELIADGSVKRIVDKYININGCSEDIVGVPVSNTSASERNLIVGTSADFQPYEYIDGDYYYGIDIEIAKLLADKLGYNLIIVNNTFESVVPAVAAYKYDMGIAALVDTDERREAVDFSIPYLTNTQVVIVPENSSIKDIDDIKLY